MLGVQSTSGDGSWVLVPGTPATCVQLALFHYELLFPNAPSLATRPIDLVLSGPNHGRNTTAAFALSSGTIGGALEATICSVRGIALSYAFFTKTEGEDLVREASSLAIRVIENLCENWSGPEQSGPDPHSAKPDLYSINVPLQAGVSKQPVRWTWMLDNKWRTGSLYQRVKSPELQAASEKSKHPEKVLSFRWSPSFADVWKTVEDSPAGNDGKVIREGCTSVTPLRANFEGLWGREEFTGDLML